MTDPELLGRYTTDDDQQAFAELARRHTPWVFSCAKRLVRDGELAEDVTQAVFILLARKAGGLTGKSNLAGWLFRATQYSAREAMRSQTRRVKHEREAAMRQEATSEGEAHWEEIGPVLDEAVGRLRAKDRDAVLLRFYQGMSFSQLAATIGIGEEAAKKRVQRALETLRGMLARKGVLAGVSGLGVLMTEKVTEAAPAAVADRMVETVGRDVGATTVSAIAEGARSMMVWAKLKFAAVMITAVSIGVIASAEVVIQTGSSSAAATRPVASESAPADPHAGSGGPKAAFRAMVEHARKLEVQGIADSFHCETPDEQQFAMAYAEDIVAQERFKRAMEDRFGYDERYSLMGAGNTISMLPMERATERITGDRAVVEVAIGPGNVMAVPMRRVAGKWRLPVGELWETIRKVAAAQKTQIPPMAQVTDQAQHSAPVHRRLADAVKGGSYESADAALEAEDKEMSRAAH